VLWLTDAAHRVVGAACERLVPGSGSAGAADYVDGLLGAFAVDPPRIWAGGPFSGRLGGRDGFSRFLPLGAMEELAWRTRIEGSQGRPEREWNGPVVGLQQRYAEGLEALGRDFADVGPDHQDARLAAEPGFRHLLHAHACESMYGDPVYGGNRNGAGWRAIAFPGDVQPRGWTDVEVSGRD
jgi:hypothetical protein